MENVAIRSAELADIPVMIDLLHQLFSIERDFSFNPVKHQMGLRLLINSKERGIVLVAEIAGEVIGMVTTQTTISTAEGTIAWTLEDMVVDERHRGKSIGTALMNHILTWAKKQGITRIQLLADKTNKAALAFYKKLDWKQTKLVCLRIHP